ncbi:MAG: lysophospholipid acyltransferase family protein [Parvularculales bacterium]
MIILCVRSLIFAVCFYSLVVASAIRFIVWSPSTPEGVQRYQERWLGRITTAMRVVVGIKSEVRGYENIPDGPVIFASAHQSAWDTLYWPLFVSKPSIVLKKELTYIPLFGRMIMNMNSVSINRSMGATALKSLIRQSRSMVEQQRSIVIFPTGTRTQPGVRADYKPGVAALYTNLNMPCVPVSTNLGVFWPRRSFIRKPGVYVVSFGEPIPPGLKRREFMAQLEQRIETENERLLEETQNA